MARGRRIACRLGQIATAQQQQPQSSKDKLRDKLKGLLK